MTRFKYGKDMFDTLYVMQEDFDEDVERTLEVSLNISPEDARTGRLGEEPPVFIAIDKKSVVLTFDEVAELIQHLLNLHKLVYPNKEEE